MDAVGQGSSRSSSTPMLVGSIVGGLAAVTLIAFLLWFWRKRVLQKRRSTLLTPLSVPPTMRDREKMYEIDRGSVGPTPRTVKLVAALGYSFRKFENRLRPRPGDGSSGVNMNRGNSQFVEPVPTHSHSNSVAIQQTVPEDVISTKDRLVDWWSRLKEDVNFNWRLRNQGVYGGSFKTRGMRQKDGAHGQPDFLTLLGMDENKIDRESQQRRAGRGDSMDSIDRFLGDLAVKVDGSEGPDPFSDANAIARSSAKPDNTDLSRMADPFSDRNAIRPPALAQKPRTTYINEVERSTGPFMSGAQGLLLPPGSISNTDTHSVYSDGAGSDNSFGPRRTKFRSDPFDLEIDDRHLPGARTQPMPRNTTTSSTYGVSRPGSARARKESFSSRYTSGVSMGPDWGDPGPDVGPAITKADSPGGYQAVRAAKRQSSKSQSSPGVGKAL